MSGNENSEERYTYFGRLDLLVINKKWAVKTVHLKIYRLGVNEHLGGKKRVQSGEQTTLVNVQSFTAKSIPVLRLKLRKNHTQMYLFDGL